MVPMTRIERVTSPLPRECSTTELHRPEKSAGPLDSCLTRFTNPTYIPYVLRHEAGTRHQFSSLCAADSKCAACRCTGAGEGNRTLVVSLEGFCSTIELHPPLPARPAPDTDYRTATACFSATRDPDTLVRPDCRADQIGQREERLSGGGGRIRTFEGRAGRFTVCSL